GAGILQVNRVRADGLAITAGKVKITSTATGTTPAGEVGSTNSTSVIDTGANFSIATGGTLDLANNDLVVRGGTLGTLSGTTYSGITGLVQSGRTTGGSWTGTGITSSTAALHVSNMALGVLTAA